MAPIEEMFKGNIGAGIAVGITAAMVGPGNPGIGSIFGRSQDPVKGRPGVPPRNFGRDGEIATDLVAEARAELDRQARAARARRGPTPWPNAGPQPQAARRSPRARIEPPRVRRRA